MKIEQEKDVRDGIHNLHADESAARIIKGNTFRDLSTICVIPTLGMIHAKVVQSWLSLMTPMNQKFIRIFAMNMEVGDAYSSALEQIVNTPALSEFKFILSLEDDNMPPPDGLIKLYESTDQYDVVGGLYWTKGESGQPMIYGDPTATPMNFIPQAPKHATIQETNGLGMGFTLFKMSLFKDERIHRPWFKTVQNCNEGVTACYTQDLYFFETIRRLGYRVACDTRVRVGHYEKERDIVW